MNESILITGANGFIGGSLARSFRHQGVAVEGLVRRNVTDISFPVTVTDYKIRELSSLIAEIKPGTIIHAAGSASVGLSQSEPIQDFTDSVLLFQRIMDATRISGERPRVVFLSSAAVYGNPAVLPISEIVPQCPISPYGYHKFICETIAKEYSNCFGIPTLILRLFSLFGATQKRLLIWEIFEQFRNKEKIVLQGTGDEQRDFMHIDDLAYSIIRLLPKISNDHMIIQIASGRSLSVRDVVTCIKTILGYEKPIVFRGLTRIGDPNIWQADVSKFEQLSEYAMPANFFERLKETITQWSD